jgi:hypothetical protein
LNPSLRTGDRRTTQLDGSEWFCFGGKGCAIGATVGATARKPWKKKTPVEVMLDQINRLRDDLARREEELKAAKRQLEKLEAASPGLGSDFSSHILPIAECNFRENLCSRGSAPGPRICAKREALIVGKGNKHRSVFFTEGCLQWINQYLLLTADRDPALLVTKSGSRLSAASVHKMFERLSEKAALGKRVTPHILRHTVATNLLRNGCPIGYIKEILGHNRLETTCHYYLGALNKTDAKDAFDAYMRCNTASLQGQVSRAKPPNGSALEGDRG